MKRILLFLFLYFCFGPFIVEGAWYGGGWYDKTLNDGATPCPTDGNTVGGSPSFWNPLTSSFYAYDSQVIAESGNYMYCQFWDGQNPSITLSDYNSSWRAPFNLTLYVSDTGGSGIASARYRWNAAPDCVSLTSGTAFGNGTVITVGPPYSSNTLYLCAKDVSGNVITLTHTYNIDNVAPTISATPSVSPSTWTNANVNVTLSCSDPSWTSCTKLQYSWTNSTATPGAYSNTLTGTNPSTIATQTANGTWYLHVRAEDAAMPNVATTYYGPFLIDKIIPTASDIIGSNPVDNSHLLAVASQNFIPSVSAAGGSPITTVKVFFEDYNTVNSLKGVSNECVSGCAQDIRNVFNDTNSNGARQYRFQVARVCDQAGNCLGVDSSASNLKTFSYNVYANTLSSNILKTLNSSQLTSASNIADGTLKNITVNLKDTYGNPIIPATGIGRTIDIKWDIANTMNLNQRNRNGGSSVFVNRTTDSTFLNTRLPSGLTEFTSEVPTSVGDYVYGFKFYTPTSNQAGDISDINANFIINNIKFDINRTTMIASGDNPSDQLVGGPVTALFNPPYTTKFEPTSELVIYGFIEGTVQNNSMSVDSYSARSSTDFQNPRVYLEFGKGVTPTTFTNMSMNYGTTGMLGKTAYTPSNSFSLLNSYLTSFTLGNLYTKLIQTGVISGLQDAYLSSHVSYTLDGNLVVYNSDIIGKPNYWYAGVTNNAVQSGLKIVGTTSTKSSSELTTNQFSTDVSILGNIYKASLKKEVVEGAYSYVKGVIPNDGVLQIRDLSNFANNNATTGNGGVALDNASVLYFGQGSNYKVELGNGDEIVTGKKTILIIGGDLFIKNNISYSNRSMDNLGIIVLKDKNGKGGNIFIHPDVTRIEATIFAEKSLLSSSDGVNAYDGNTSQVTLKNQLYIYGSVFSENTIGGSRASPVMCPYYEVCSPTDLVLAQKYDLNYLRRYFIYDSNTNGSIDNADIAANGGQNYKTVSLGANSYNTTFYSYARYPVVIEYNPGLSTNPPPLFTK